MTFRDIVKKSILFGVGAVYMTKDEVEKFIKSLEKDGKITPTEGKKVVREVMSDAEKKWKKLALKKKFEKFLEEEFKTKKGKKAAPKKKAAKKKTVKKSKKK